MQKNNFPISTTLTTFVIMTIFFLCCCYVHYAVISATSTIPWLRKKVFQFLFQHYVHYVLITVENHFISNYTFPTRYVQWFCEIRTDYSNFTVRIFSGVLIRTGYSIFTVRNICGFLNTISFLRKFSVSRRFIHVIVISPSGISVTLRGCLHMKFPPGMKLVLG